MGKRDGLFRLRAVSFHVIASSEKHLGTVFIARNQACPLPLPMFHVASFIPQNLIILTLCSDGSPSMQSKERDVRIDSRPPPPLQSLWPLVFGLARTRLPLPPSLGGPRGNGRQGSRPEARVRQATGSFRGSRNAVVPCHCSPWPHEPTDSLHAVRDWPIAERGMLAVGRLRAKHIPLTTER